MNVRGPGRLGREGAGGPDGGKRRPEGTRWGGGWDFRRQSPFAWLAFAFLPRSQGIKPVGDFCGGKTSEVEPHS